MAKIRAEDVRHGPIRWLLRIASVMFLIGGIMGVMGVESSMSYIADSPVQMLAFGILLIGLDILVWATDPRRKYKAAQRAAQSAAGPAAEVMQLRRTVLNTLQQVRLQSSYEQVLQSCGARQMEAALRTNKELAVDFCRKNGKIEVLAYMQTVNPEAAEVLIQALIADLYLKKHPQVKK